MERLVKRHLGGVGGERGAIVLRGCFSRLDLAGNAPPLAPGMDPGQGGGEGSRFPWQEQSCDPAQPSVCWENTNRITSPVKHIFLPSPCRFHGKQWIFSLNPSDLVIAMKSPTNTTKQIRVRAAQGFASSPSHSYFYGKQSTAVSEIPLEKYLWMLDNIRGNSCYSWIC